jgi:Zn-dependent protease
MQPDLIIFSILILIFSIILHEISHGYAAEWLGDPTARLSGRLTLNPIPHIDPLGSLLIPGILILTGAQFLIGWAKPVPYNPYNLTRGGKYAEAIVAGAGAFTNICLALIFGFLIRFLAGAGMLSQEVLDIASVIVYVNLLLAFFNLIPIPPLDGSKILATLLPYGAQQAFRRFELVMAQWGFIGLFIFIYLFFTFISPVFSGFLRSLFVLITGIPL